MINKRLKKHIATALAGILVSGVLSTNLEANAEDKEENSTEALISASTEKSTVKKGKVTSNSLNVRRGPSTKDPVIGSVKKGAIVEIVSTSQNGWYKIKYGKEYGYVSGKYISILSNSDSNNDISSSTKVTHTGTVNTSSLNVRSGASASSSKIGSLSKGNKVNIVEKMSNGWYKIQYKNGYGYISGSYIANVKPVDSSNGSDGSDSNDTSSTKVTYTGTVNTSSLNVRSGASASSSKIGSLSKGNKVNIVEKMSNGWYKIQYKNGYGYISGSYISNVKPVDSSNGSDGSDSNDTSSSIKVTYTGTVNTSSLNVRSGASASSSKIGSLSKGNKVNIVEKMSNGWYKIQYKNGYGYISGSYISNVKPVDSSNDNEPSSPDTTVIKTGKVNTTTLNLRSGASTKYSKIGSLLKGDKVEIVNIESNGWYKIKYKNGYAYVSGSYIDIDKDSNSGSDTEEGKSIVTGLLMNQSKTAGQSLTNTIEVSPAFGRKVYLQMYNNSNRSWETKATFTTENTETSSVNLVYPSQWYNQVSSTWRVHIPATGQLDGYTSKTINITAKRVYENPSGYIQLKEHITVTGGGQNLVRGTMGLKVAKVQRRLGMGHVWEIVGPSTISNVMAFQRKNNLKPTGIVDLTTWKKMGFDESSWYTLDAYVTPVKTKLTATRSDLIEQMIDTAESYLGTEYVVGAAGVPGSGTDCSGLVMQAMYSIGIDPAPVSVTRHARPGYEYESRNLWNLPTLKTVTTPKRGDLVFYKNSKGSIIHVAIYLGNNRVIESWPEKVVNWPLIHPERPLIKGYKRVIG